MTARGLRDSALIDTLEAAPSTTFGGNVWRVVRSSRNALQCSSYGGRWDDGTFDVLYTSCVPDGAIAEMYFHLSRGQPVMPSQVSHNLYELQVELKQALEVMNVQDLKSFGVDTSRYGALSYVEKQLEYPRTQEFAETAHFVGFDGLIVPNARWECLNVIVFCDRVDPEPIEVSDNGNVNWVEWVRAHPV